ncbi:MAG: hypothetical protein H7Y86_04795 [Rhizobacter sp.]|nr:hypothetical protein [Ferruginibacter sp.]
MKKILSWLLFVLCYCHVYSQSFVTKFVEKKKIQWAGYIVDTAHFPDPNLSLLLRNRLERDEIKVLLPYFFGLYNTGIEKTAINYITKDSLFDHPTHRNADIPIYDTNGNRMEPLQGKKEQIFFPLPDLMPGQMT